MVRFEVSAVPDSESDFLDGFCRSAVPVIAGFFLISVDMIAVGSMVVHLSEFETG